MRFLGKIVGVKLAQLKSPGDAVDIGCGAKFITSAFTLRGLPMVGTESDAAIVTFARSMQPDLAFYEADLLSSIDPERYAFIFTREVYLFTSVNEFDQQQRVLSNLLDSLRPMVLCYLWRQSKVSQIA